MIKRKKRKIDDDSGADIGMVMTVSLFLILLTFFILLNSIAVIDENRTRLAIGSLIGAFGGLPGGLSPMETGKSVLPPSAPMIEEELTIEQLMSYVQRDLKELTGDIKLETIADQSRIIINEAGLFMKNEYTINPSIKPLLDRLGHIINKGSFPVEIAGYTDNIVHHVKGYQSNWEMSAIMALKVVKYFVSQCGVTPDRLTAYGCGNNRPITSNESIESRAQNRRVEIDLKYKAPAYIKRIFRKNPAGFFTYKKFDFKIF
ncbi:MAG: OmpA family protein [Deltaproteobacteria bacterium]|jgi:chemotaxis protein MotB|nr:OmpA family protein [Deltaproteobacteria bacterium]